MRRLTLVIIFAFTIYESLAVYTRNKVIARREAVKYPDEPPHLLWPAPIEYVYGSKQITIQDPCNFSFNTDILNTHPEVSEIFQEYKNFMFSDACPTYSRVKKIKTNDPNSILNIYINETSSLMMNLDTDESYSLDVRDGNITLTCNSYPGALRGLETFSQLVQTTQDSRTGKTIFVIPATPVLIKDAPRFAHRGLMLDTCRHFISKNKILSILDGMMFTKLNVFHWHLADTDSFAFFFPSHPNLTLYGAFSPKEVYSQQDIQEIVSYAILRGIRIIPELDTPAHVGGWAFAPEAQPFINCSVDGTSDDNTLGTPLGQVNPILNGTYELIQDLLNDLNTYFPWEFIHLGADEVDPYCWNNTDIYNFMKENNIPDFPAMFNYYVNRERSLVNQTKTRIYWLNPATNYLKFQPDEIVQWWGDTPSLGDAFGQFPQNKFIISNYDYFYLDCGFGDYFGGESWCDPLHTWLQIAQFPLNNSVIEDHEDQILGLEVALWSELNNDAMVLGRTFPRAASLGEKAWSPDSNVISNQLSIFARLDAWTQRNNARGIPTGPISTGYCEMNPAKCFV